MITKDHHELRENLTGVEEDAVHLIAQEGGRGTGNSKNSAQVISLHPVGQPPNIVRASEHSTAGVCFETCRESFIFKPEEFLKLEVSLAENQGFSRLALLLKPPGESTALPVCLRVYFTSLDS